MPKKYQDSDRSSTPHKKQRCSKLKLKLKSSEKRAKNSKPSCNDCGELNQLNRRPCCCTTGKDQFPCSYSPQRCKKTTKTLNPKRKCCRASNSTADCPSHEKNCPLDKSGISKEKNECCCRQKSKTKKEKLEKRQEVLKVRSSPREEEKHCRATVSRKQKTEICNSRVEEEGAEAGILNPPEGREDLSFKSCNCSKTRIKEHHKKSCNSSEFCCIYSCFKKFLKKEKKQKKKKAASAPCKRYLCLYNSGRAECDKPVPCVNCTHNCNARYLEGSGKKRSKREKLIKSSHNSSSKTLECSRPKNSCEATTSGVEKILDDLKSNELRNDEKCETEKPHQSVMTEKKRSSEKVTKCDRKQKHENIRKSNSKRKYSKNREKLKTVAYCLPNSLKIAKRSSSAKNERCSCKILEKVRLKAKPCMRYPDQETVDKKNSSKKLTFESCKPDLNDKKLQEDTSVINNETKKRSTAIRIIFDVIFWPYVFWPPRGLCE